MQIKIFFGEKPVYLCDELTPDLKEMLHNPDVVFIDERSAAAINSLLHEMKKADFKTGIMLSDKFNLLKKAFFKHFVFIEAAGGIVMNCRKEILFIRRKGKWDLPKGKLDAGEDPENAATREITEETGVTQLSLKKKIGDTYHVYDEFGKHILKQSHWYYFTCSLKQHLQPQIQEDITEAVWFATKDIRMPMDDTYGTIRDIMQIFFDTP